MVSLTPLVPLILPPSPLKDSLGSANIWLWYSVSAPIHQLLDDASLMMIMLGSQNTLLAGKTVGFVDSFMAGLVRN